MANQGGSYVYVRDSNLRVARSIEVPGGAILDVDEDGRALGIETLGRTHDLTDLWEIIKIGTFGIGGPSREDT